MGKSSYNRAIITTLVVSALLIASLILIERYFNDKIEETRIAQYADQQTLTAVQTASSLKDFVDHLGLELSSLSGQSNLEIDPTIFSNYHRNLIESVTFVIRVDSSGKPIQSALNNTDFLRGEIFTFPQATKKNYVSEMRLEDKTYLAVSVPVFKKDYEGKESFDGIIAALLDTDLMEQVYLEQIKIGLSGYVWAINEDGTLETGANYRWKGLQKGDNYLSWVKSNYPENSAGINRMMAEDKGYTVDKWGENGRIITSYSHVNLGGEKWIVAVSTPFSELEGAIRDMQQKLLFFLIAAIAILSVAFIFLLLSLRSKEMAVQKLEKAEITLEKLGIKSIPEYSENSYLELDENRMYLINDKYREKSLNLFFNLVNKQYPGFAVIRTPPDEIRKQFNFENTPFIWLRKAEGEKAATADTDSLLKTLSEFVKKNEKSAILIERLDYIIVHNGFEKTLKFIHSLKDSLKSTIVLVSINSTTLNEVELNLLKEEMQDISTIIDGKMPKLADDLYRIVEFLYMQHKENRKVVFKDISKNFSITKPTTKKKLVELHGMGLIELKAYGRVKEIAITEKAKEYIEKKD